MKIRSILLKNFLSHKNTYIDFTNPTTCIIGANGNGKSAILKGICYALYGRIPSSSRISDMDLVHTDALGQMFVEIGVEKDGTSRKIKRGRLPDTTPILEVEGFNGNKTTQEKQLQEWLGITYEDFIALYYFTQDDIHQFLQGDKAAYFTRWTDGLKKWYAYEDAIKSERKQIKKEIELLDKEYAVLLAKMSQYETIEQREQELLQKQTELNESYGKGMELLSDLQSKKEALEAQKEEYDRLDTHLQVERARIDSEIRSVRRDLERTENCTCPILEIGCDLLKQHRDQAQPTLHLFLEELEEKRDALTKDMPTFDLEAYHTILSRIQKGQSYTQKIFSDVQVIAFQIEKINEEKGERDATIQTQNVNREQYMGLIQRDKDLSYLQYACSDKGIPLFILIQEMQKVEEIANWILGVMESSQRLSFSPFQELQEYEKVCPVCESRSWKKGHCTECGTPRPHKRKYQPTIDVFSGKEKRNFELVSGGEKVLLSFAVRLACSHLVSSLTGVSSEMIILDETFAMLDDENRSKLLNLCVERLPTLGIKQILVISHHDDVTTSIPSILRVDKVDGVSTIS